MFSFVNTDNNSNLNVPTKEEIVNFFPNFKKTQEVLLSLDYADKVIDDLQKQHKYVVFTYESYSPEYSGDFISEVYNWNFTLHVFYYDMEKNLYHKMYKRCEDELAVEMAPILFPYEEYPVVNFNYDILRKYKFPVMNSVRSSIL